MRQFLQPSTQNILVADVSSTTTSMTTDIRKRRNKYVRNKDELLPPLPDDYFRKSAACDNLKSNKSRSTIP